MIVMKFGGTSNSDAAAMTNVIRIVRAHLPQKPFVVISAIARATNALEKIARSASAGDREEAEAALDRLFAQHREIVKNLLQRDRDGAREVLAVIDSFYEELRKLIQGVSILRELTPRSMDAFCSYGERLSSRIVAAGLREAGVPAVWLDAREFMITDDSYGRAMPLMETVTERLETVARPLVDAGKVPVTQGFIGFTRSGTYTTMGRESSDFSASIIGAAMNASRVQIWTDVDGILTADPRMVQDAKRIGSMSFEEAFELSYFGAKILHPNTMLPLLAGRIPVEIRNSRREEAAGTVVDSSEMPADSRNSVKSIAFQEGLALVSLTPHRRLNQYLFWEEIFSVLSRNHIVVGNLSTSEYSIAFTVSGQANLDVLKTELEQFGVTTIQSGKGSLCVVGRGLRESSDVFSRVFEALKGTAISMVSHGASGLSLTVVLEQADIASALKKVHAALFS